MKNPRLEKGKKKQKKIILDQKWKQMTPQSKIKKIKGNEKKEKKKIKQSKTESLNI